MNLAEEIKKVVKGEVETADEVLEKYSKDTSLFKVRPAVVVFPKDKEDVEKLVRFTSDHKDENSAISVTARAAGSDMSGGPLNESIIMDLTRHMGKIIHVDEKELEAEVEPGVFYRDFEKETLEKLGILLPSYPASKNLAALGGMIANNSAGERSLKYGKTDKYVKELEVVLADGNTYELKKLSKDELLKKCEEKSFEGEIYRKTYKLLDDNFERVQNARPDVSKNSAGYALWDVWDREHFDLTKLFVGSQGTLGMITKAKLGLVKDMPHKRLAVVFFKHWDNVPQVVNKVLPLDPEELEAFDEETIKLGLKFMPQIAERVGESVFSFLLDFLPEAIVGAQMFAIPDLIMLVQFAEDTESEVEIKLQQLEELLKDEKVILRVMKNEEEAEKYWVVRRESFALLRKSVGDKRTAPFIDDVVVKPEYLPKFLPEVLKILKEHEIYVTMQGHPGSGNFHIIPLMDLSRKEERDKILSVSDKVYDLVVKYKGSITGEHNDGIIRTPYLEQMYGKEIYGFFKQVKDIFDPKNIFNPGKKVGGSKAYIASHISSSNL